MKGSEINEVIECVDQGRTLFYYFKDRYCFDLLAYTMESANINEWPINLLKKHPYGRFLQKQTVNKALLSQGKNSIDLSDLALCQPTDQIPFTLSLSRWGHGNRGWDQTTRNQSNLVLQLNFSNQHKARLRQLLQPENGDCTFNFSGHPTRVGERDTFAWARLDVSLETDEVLIEEIQCDWLKAVDWLVRRVQYARRYNEDFEPCDTHMDIKCTYEQLLEYSQKELQPYRAIWAEAMLTAALFFIRKELGITHVFYHSYETGKKLKAVPGNPPRSLYTQLPKQFCFEPTTDAPGFLMQDKFARRCLRKVREPKWFKLIL